MTDDVWSFPQELAHSGRERSVWIRDSGNIRINRMLCTCEGWAAACGWSVCSRHNKDNGACETRVLGVRWCDIVCGSDSRVSSVGLSRLLSGGWGGFWDLCVGSAVHGVVLATVFARRFARAQEK